MVGVQDEEHVQGPHHGRVDVVGLVGHAEGQADEVLDVGALRVGVEQRQADGAPGDIADHRGQLGQQQHRGELALVGVVRIEGVLVVGGQARDPGLEDRHRVARRGEGGEEAAEVLMQEPVARDAPLHACEGLAVGQIAVDEEVGDLQEGRGLGQLLDRVAAVTQDPGRAVDVGDLRGARRRVGEARVERHHAGGAQQLGHAQAVSAVGRRGARQLEVGAVNSQQARTTDGAGPALVGLLSRGGGGGARHHASWGSGPHASRRRDLDPRGSGGPSDHCTGCAVTALFHGLITGHRIGRSARISPPGAAAGHPSALDKLIKALVSG